MWHFVSLQLIRYRLPLMAALLTLTAFMAYWATQAEMSYDFSSAVPPNDPEKIFLQKFKEKFGDDGNIIAVGVCDSALYQVKHFEEFEALSQKIESVEGVRSVWGIPSVKIIEKDTAAKKFVLRNLFPDAKLTQAKLDSVLALLGRQKFYMGQLVNPQNGAALLIVSVDKDYIYSEKRVALTHAIQQAAAEFTKTSGVKTHIAGIPFIRAVIAEQVKNELNIFLYLSALVTGVIMFLFFRSFRAVIFSLFMIGIVVIWVIGSLSLLGYKITLLSGLIPPVIVTIGITNAIYLLNKYHLEFAKCGDKEKAILAVIRKMGLATFLTNLTVAVSFLALLSTRISILREFGLVAGLNIIVLFAVSLIVIPAVLWRMPAPKPRHLKHLHFKIAGRIVSGIDSLVQHHRALIYAVALLFAFFSVYGILKLRSVSYMVDDVPEGSIVKKDLHFFEENFSGVMPLVIWVDCGKKRGLLDLKNLTAIDNFEAFLDSIPHVSRPVSLISLVKASKQAFYNGNPDRYELPTAAEKGFILRYMKGPQETSALLKSFADPSLQQMRISMQMSDLGSLRLDSLINKVIKPGIERYFAGTKIKARPTGTVTLFIKGNKYLIDNLQESLWWAFGLISLSMAILFANLRIILIALIPNLLALMITGGLMGYFGIPLKASTALIFSISFGISVDNSIRFLAKYRQEQKANNFFVPRSVSESILETGKSIIYTSIVLFAGFIIFAFSNFGGTIALGVLTSITLGISMLTNLILLPALLMTFDPHKKKDYSLIDDFDPEFYREEDDEIDISKSKKN